ncbi:MAG: alpha/beta fold hydrolase [Promethearchaeota archaeon]|jgi:pimeloyl-ACP methyl ester carboxylesterase
MPKAKVNDIEIEYETFGDPSSKPLLLVMGLGTQMIAWLDEMCETLANQGFYVIRFDNRDVGLSTKFEEAGLPDLAEIYAAVGRGESVEVPYTIEDMADDAIGVLDALNIDKAHICGASMGGEIAQVIAYRHPKRVLSLTSIMSTTGNRDLPKPSDELMQEMFAPIPPDRESIIKQGVRYGKLTYGTFPYNEEKAYEMGAKAYDRSYFPLGSLRQMAAIFANGNRKPKLASINVPTLVVHGREDPLAPVEGGIDTAEAIPGAELLIIEGMGHSFPPEVVPQILDAIIAHANKVNS